MPRASGITLGQLLAEASGVELATLADVVRDPAAYTFELKFDGYRMLAVKVGRDVRLISRAGHDWTARFDAVASEASKLKVRACILDGEVCALDAKGIPSFHRLQQWQNSSEVRRSLVYVTFDLLNLEGVDVRSQPIEARREALRELVAHHGSPRIAFSESVEGDPSQILQSASDAGLEGIVAKRRGTPYRVGRQPDWLKLKCLRRQEFAIVGYLPLKGVGPAMGGLVLGVAEGEGFVFAGRVGTGFSAKERLRLARLLDVDAIEKSPVRDAPRLPGVRWVVPRHVAEVSFVEWTVEGIRHPSFVGLRDDKRPEDCRRERPLAQ